MFELSRSYLTPGRLAGELVKFRRADGLEIEVPVPAGLKAGDYFDADPPALMVRVPENTQGGEVVVFRSLRRQGDDVEEGDWCSAVVPQGVAPGKFFCARLPPPVKPDEEDDSSSSGSESEEDDSPKKGKDTKKAAGKKADSKRKKKGGCC